MAQAIKKISADLALKLIEDQIKVVLNGSPTKPASSRPMSPANWG